MKITHIHLERPLLTVVMAVLFTSGSSFARDLYVLQGNTGGVDRIWSTDALFYNRGSSDGQVTIVSISNPSDRGGRVGQSFAVQPNKTASLQQAVRGIPNSGLMMVHLDVEGDLVVEDVLYMGRQVGDTLPIYRTYGKVRLPVFGELVPANQRQVHLETDIGNIEAHLNVGIYNASDQVATAHIETHEHCDDGTISTETISVPPDTVVQIGPFQAEAIGCNGASAGIDQKSSIYTVVTVDQPSLTFVSALANAVAPSSSISISGE